MHCFFFLFIRLIFFSRLFCRVNVYVSVAGKRKKNTCPHNLFKRVDLFVCFFFFLSFAIFCPLFCFLFLVFFCFCFFFLLKAAVFRLPVAWNNAIPVYLINTVFVPAGFTFLWSRPPWRAETCFLFFFFVGGRFIQALFFFFTSSE
ncbi:unnamed protein product [Ixodes persulcatus]